MAKISYDGLTAYMKQLEELGADVDKAARYAVYPAAGYVLEELKAATPVDTGDLRNSERLTKFVSENDSVYTTIIFDGRDRKGVANELKARVLESGSSKRKKQPFIRPTLRRVAERANQMMRDNLDEYIKNLMEGK